eukprot:GHVS01023487.1.p1 GENE.GHVS01023487.1~~GHVS01023487.1.p1  ORF type:complete len:393 (-),score=36.92 GHVS01023487.1:74-1252(-)
MKLLAAVPPLLFLALYFLSFIHLSVSPKSKLLSCLETSGTTEVKVTTTPDVLTEESLIKAVDVLKNSKETEETLQDMSLILWSLGGIKTVASSTRENAIAVVKATFANNVDYPQTDVSVEKVLFIPCGDIVVTLKCGKEVGEVRYSPHPDQKDERKLAGYKEDITNESNGLDDLYLSCGFPILPYIHALGKKPRLVVEPVTVEPWTVSDRFTVQEEPGPVVYIKLVENYYRLRRYSDVTIKRKKDYNETVLCKYRSYREGTVDSSKVKTAQGFTKDCIWNGFIEQRKASYNNAIAKLLDSQVEARDSGDDETVGLEIYTHENEYSVTTGHSRLQLRTTGDDRVLKIEVVTLFPGSGDKTQADNAAYIKPGEINMETQPGLVFHDYEFDGLIP